MLGNQSQLRLSARRIEGNLLFGARGEVTAWFVLPTQRWAFLTYEKRCAMVDAFALRMSLLVRHSIHLRVTTVPFGVGEWARNLEAHTAPAASCPPEGGPFHRWVEAQQEQVAKATTDEKAVYVGVTLRKRQRQLTRAAELAGAGTHVADKAVLREAGVLAEYVAGDGWDGRPATQEEIEWLLRRSIGLGMPPPHRMSPAGEDTPLDAEDVTEVVDGVQLHADPFGGTVKVVRMADANNKKRMTRYVAVLTLGRIERAMIGAPVPWMTVTDRFPWPIEWSVRMDVVDGETARGTVFRKLLIVRDQQKQLAAHGLEERKHWRRRAKKALDVEDEMTSGNAVKASRLHGWIQVAVAASSEEKVLERARRIMDAYLQYQMRMEHSHGLTGAGQQHALALSFIPGERRASKAHIRRIKLQHLAAGMPTASASLGDNQGAYIGYTSGGNGRRAVFVDTHYSTEVLQKEGLWAVTASLGGGKSSLAAAAFIYPSVQRLISTYVWDPSGPMKQLCELPEFKGRARHIDLGDQAPGTLSPFGVVAEPRPADYATGEEYRREQVRAAALRRQLAIDTIMGLLPREYAQDGRAALTVRRAVKMTRGAQTASLRTVIEFLQGMHTDGETFGTLGRELAEYLDDIADMPMAQLLFPAMTGNAPRIGNDDKVLTVITLQGVQLPEHGVDRFSLDPSMQIVLPVLQLATWLTVRGIYSGPMRRRKTVVLDEAHWLADWPAGKALFNRLGHDNRKWNTCVAALSQTPDEILSMGDAASLLAGAFVGRIEDDDMARRALRLLRVGEDSGYQTAITRLGLGPDRERQFVFRDADGRVDRLNVDISHLPDLLEALDTNAKSPAPAVPVPDVYAEAVA